MRTSRCCWWALEAHAISERPAILKHFKNSSSWSPPLAGAILPRLARLYATLPTTENQQALAALLTVPISGANWAVKESMKRSKAGRRTS